MSSTEGHLKLTKSEILSLGSRGYKILKKVNEGAFAKVYRSEYKKNKPDEPIFLACKIMDISLAPPEFVRKFLPREIDALIRLRHPYLVHTHSIFLRRNKYFIFMRYMENGDLLEYIMHKGAVPEYQARLWFRQLSLAVQYMHTLEMAHRDIKCENVLLTANRNAKLSDFGFCRSCVDKNRTDIVSATFCGSLSYTAPEIVSGRQYYPKPTDIWSLGIVLYVMLNKELPFSQTVTKALYKAQMAKNWKWKKPYTASEACRRLLYDMLDPLIETRPKITDVVNSTWFKLDSRFHQMMPHELEAYNNARHAVGLEPIKHATQNLIPMPQGSSQINLLKHRNSSNISQVTPGTSKSPPKPAHNNNKEKTNKDPPLDSQKNYFYVVEKNNAMLPIKSAVTTNIVTTDVSEHTILKTTLKIKKADKNSAVCSSGKIEQKKSSEKAQHENLNVHSNIEDIRNNQRPSSSQVDNTKPTNTYIVNTNNTLKPRKSNLLKSELKKDIPLVFSKTLERKINDNIFDPIRAMTVEVNNEMSILSTQKHKPSSLLNEFSNTADNKLQSEVKDRLDMISERETVSSRPSVKSNNLNSPDITAEAKEDDKNKQTNKPQTKDATTGTSNSKVQDKAKLYITSTTTYRKYVVNKVPDSEESSS